MNYYNEFDPYAAEWLEELILNGQIPKGIVDKRSITEVQPKDLYGFTQCHFFSGIGGWPLALQLAGWPADRPVWTGSCPCQPFSVAGKGKGAEDERHLWPDLFRLAAECRPSTIFGEQVASPDALFWLNGIRSDLEGEGYGVGAVCLGAHSVGAPHQRQRLYWVANTQSEQWERGGDEGRGRGESSICGNLDPMANGQREGLEGYHRNGDGGGEPGRIDSESSGSTPARGGTGSMDHPDSHGAQRTRGEEQGTFVGCEADPTMGNTEGGEQWRFREPPEVERWELQAGGSSPWSDSASISCRDGNNRRIPAQSVLQFVADGISGTLGDLRVQGYSEAEALAIGRASYGFPIAEKVMHRIQILKGAGNAIVPQVAATFIRAFMEIPAPGAVF